MEISWDENNPNFVNLSPEERNALRKASFVALMNVAAAAYDEYVAKREKIHEQVVNTRTGQQQKYFEDAIDALSALYVSDHPKEEDDDLPITSYTEILSLYLNRDFNRVLLKPLEELYQSYNFKVLDDFQIAEKVSELVRRCTNKMSHEILKYPLIDVDIMLNIFQNKLPIIKNSIEASIKYFLELSKQEKEDVLAAAQERERKIEQQIKFLCGEIHGRNP